MDPNPKQQVVERLKTANNVLITVSSSPTVDQLAACIGFTLLMNKLGKHATAVFSGTIPSTIEFLQPEKTIETNTDSLRDFIIALDKSKADKLRYKVEDDVVRIFITPYKTSLSEKDLDFSQGDFNVDVVLAIGVINKEAIDQAIMAHGRILHDATVMTIANGQTPSDVGSINWYEPTASSLSEMLVSITESFGSGLLDAQMATSFLTGIVSETGRFSNEKTTPKIMTMSAQLMAAGANQQLIPTKLAPPPPPPVVPPIAVQEAPQSSDQAAILPPVSDGEIEIIHDVPELVEQQDPEDEDEIHIDDQGNLKRQQELQEAAEAEAKAKAEEEAAEASEPAEDQAQLDPSDQPALGIPPPDQHAQEQSYIASDAHKVIQPLQGQVIDPLAGVMPEQNSTLPPINLPPIPSQALDVPAEPEMNQVVEPLTMPTAPAVDEARSAVMSAALNSAPRPEATQSVGAQIFPLDSPMQPSFVVPEPVPSMPAVGDVLQQQATAVVPPVPPVPPPQIVDPMAPPPVPPPMIPMPPQVEQHHTYLNPTDQPHSEEPTQL